MRPNNLFLQVSVLCNLFRESGSDRQSKEVLEEITDYNKRYSGARRRVSSRSTCSTDFNPELKEVRYEITVTSDSFIVILALHTCRAEENSKLRRYLEGPNLSARATSNLSSHSHPGNRLPV